MVEEIHFECPCCWQAVSVLADLSVAEQDYVEDCEVCCRPLRLRLRAEDGALVAFEVEAVDQG